MPGTEHENECFRRYDIRGSSFLHTLLHSQIVRSELECAAGAKTFFKIQVMNVNGMFTCNLIHRYISDENTTTLVEGITMNKRVDFLDNALVHENIYFLLTQPLFICIFLSSLSRSCQNGNFRTPAFAYIAFEFSSITDDSFGLQCCVHSFLLLLCVLQCFHFYTHMPDAQRPIVTESLVTFCKDNVSTMFAIKSVALSLLLLSQHGCPSLYTWGCANCLPISSW